MRTWKLIAGRIGLGHCLYESTAGQLAITDDSIRSRDNPGSTDEGLMLVDKVEPILVSMKGVMIPVRVARDNDCLAYTSGSLFADLALAVACKERGYPVIISSQVKLLMERLAAIATDEMSGKTRAAFSEVMFPGASD
jgi:hypothetical protein